jgi:hypothetical protein
MGKNQGFRIIFYSSMRQLFGGFSMHRRERCLTARRALPDPSAAR